MRTHHVTVGARSSLFDLPQAKLPSGPAVMLVLRKAAGESTSTVRKKDVRWIMVTIKMGGKLFSLARRNIVPGYQAVQSYHEILHRYRSEVDIDPRRPSARKNANARSLEARHSELSSRSK